MVVMGSTVMTPLRSHHWQQSTPHWIQILSEKAKYFIKLNQRNLFDLGFRLLYPNGGGGDNAPLLSSLAAKNSTLEPKPL